MHDLLMLFAAIKNSTHNLRHYSHVNSSAPRQQLSKKPTISQIKMTFNVMWTEQTKQNRVFDIEITKWQQNITLYHHIRTHVLKGS